MPLWDLEAMSYRRREVREVGVPQPGVRFVVYDVSSDRTKFLMPCTLNTRVPSWEGQFIGTLLARATVKNSGCRATPHPHALRKSIDKSSSLNVWLLRRETENLVVGVLLESSEKVAHRRARMK